MQTITKKRGDTFSHSAVYVTDSTKSCKIIDLAGYTIRSQARDLDGTTLLFDLAIGTGITIDDIAGGQYSMLVDATVTSTWTVGTYFWDIEYSVLGVVQSTETLKLIITEDITV